jgi:predicted transcriptional regulator
MSEGIASLHKVLKDETRRKIILLLSDKGSLSYVDLMKELHITSTGKINYHLKILSDLLAKNEAGQYTLTEKGKLASRLLLEFPEEKRMGKPKWWRPSGWNHSFSSSLSLPFFQQHTS